MEAKVHLPTSHSLAPPLCQVEGRVSPIAQNKKSNNNKEAVHWRARMCDSRARRKRNSKLQKLSKNLDNSHAIMEYYEAEIKTMEEDDDSSPPAEQPQIQWY